MKQSLSGCILIAILQTLAVISCRQAADTPLTIATAANMQFAMEELTEVFTESTGIPCDAVVSSSGKLTAQITEGAPYHVLVSADLQYPVELHRLGLTTGPPEIYAYGQLVLWHLDSVAPALGTLPEKNVRYIAIANPKTAPYGSAALELLRNSGLYEQVAPKLVFGESIGQTTQFVLFGAADIAITAQSIVLSEAVRDRGSWAPADKSLYTPIAQGIAIIKGEQQQEEDGRRFREFVFSEKGRSILDKFGYIPADR